MVCPGAEKHHSHGSLTREEAAQRKPNGAQHTINTSDVCLLYFLIDQEVFIIIIIIFIILGTLAGCVSSHEMKVKDKLEHNLTQTETSCSHTQQLQNPQKSFAR